MRFPILKHFRAARPTRPAAAVAHDADELILLWGHAAYARASDLSWREDTGLVASPGPGHWWSVRREIGRRLGQQDIEPRAEFAA